MVTILRGTYLEPMLLGADATALAERVGASPNPLLHATTVMAGRIRPVVTTIKEYSFVIFWFVRANIAGWRKS